MISSQKGREFIKSNYNDIKRVYSIWVCMNLSQNCMNYIHFTQESVVGTYQWKVILERMWGRTDKWFIRYGSWASTGNYREWVIRFNLIDKKETDITPASKERKVWKNLSKICCCFWWFYHTVDLWTACEQRIKIIWQNRNHWRFSVRNKK